MRKKYVVPTAESVGFAIEERALLMSTPLGGTNANAGNGNASGSKGDGARQFVDNGYPTLFDAPEQD